MNQQIETNTSPSPISWENNVYVNEGLNYKQLSVISLLAFLFGLLSFLVFLTLWFTFICVLGIFFAVISIVLISRSDGTLIGMNFARLGLCLSIISIVAVSVFWIRYDYNLRYEADQFFKAWFALFTQDNNVNNFPHIKSAASPYWERKDTDKPEVWWKKQYDNKYLHRDVHAAVDNKLIRVMLALGKDMNIYFYKTFDVTIASENETVTNIYIITFKDKNDNNTTKSFFVKISGERIIQIDNNLNQKKKLSGWKLTTFPEFILPEEFKQFTL
ncbi:MAG: hypothetical protein LBC74_11060 [Planctomycetaceae bacterium]|jgi:hypothetical protein|nr:hypothetical protein [Planctomycetaceae bacterium]